MKGEKDDMITDYSSFKETLRKSQEVVDYDLRMHYNRLLTEFREDSPKDYDRYFQRMRREFRGQKVFD